MKAMLRGEPSRVLWSTTIHGRMPNFTLSEILTIALVILIVFGPHRLPEIAKKTGALIRRGRLMMNELRREFESEVGDVAQPLKEVGNDLRGIRQDMTSTLGSIGDEVRKAKRDLDEKVDETAHSATGDSVAPTEGGDKSGEADQPGMDDVENGE